ncbi:MAG: FHA domain-containing protein [Actinobacteria bacterium]|nr:FHA domain-containing protein [Actinomycetota bacterium]
MISTIFETTGTQNLAWFFYWGNFTFFAVCVGLALLILLYSYYKEIKAAIFKILCLIIPVFLIPSIVFSFLSIESKTSISSFIMPFFVLGIIGVAFQIILTIIYFSISKVDKKDNYCQIHKIYYKESFCPICALDFELSDNKGFDDTIIDRDEKVKGFLINTSSSKVYNLYSSNLIGRGRSSSGYNNISIEKDQYVSRIHARIIYDGRRFKLSDSSSASGTYLNGNKITGWLTLEDGDLIKVGKTVLKFTQK